MLKKIIETIGKYNSFILVSHNNPDGDGVGSIVALNTFLKDLGKNVHSYYTGHLIATYDFLSSNGEIEQYDEAESPDSKLADAEVIILLDANEWKRTDKMEAPLRASPALKLVIDHHPVEVEDNFDMAWIDTSFSSVGEMVYSLIREMGGKITEKMGSALYVSIMTDTGSFRYSNTTSRTHRIVSELIEAGVKTSVLYQEVYERNPVEKIKLLGHCLANIHMECDDLFAWTSITRDTLKEYHAESWMLDGAVEIIRTIIKVEAIALLWELEDGNTKVRLRSRRVLDVNSLARSFGGGGHPRASGCVIAGKLEDVEKLIVQKAKEALDDTPSSPPI